MIHTHNIEPPRAVTLEGLGQALGSLRYDALETVLRALATELNNDKLNNDFVGNTELSHLARDAFGHILLAADTVNKMFKASRAYTPEDIRKHPLASKR